mmetsp:Transcript_18857/g.50531  ORF Transcript_18857/g.50531 Transcript_18857/m.50531 type:complete len:342 (-) Transcript_18857:938-1963(-)
MRIRTSPLRAPRKRTTKGGIAGVKFAPTASLSETEALNLHQIAGSRVRFSQHARLALSFCRRRSGYLLPVEALCLWVHLRSVMRVVQRPHQRDLVADGNKRGPVGELPAQGRVQVPGALLADLGGGLVQAHQPRLCQQHAREGHALLLAAGEHKRPVLLHAQVPVRRQRLQAHGAQCLQHRLVADRAGVARVGHGLPQAPLGDVRALRNEERLLHAHGAAGHVGPHPGERPEKRALASALRGGQQDALPCLHAQRRAAPEGPVAAGEGELGAAHLQRRGRARGRLREAHAVQRLELAAAAPRLPDLLLEREQTVGGRTEIREHGVCADEPVEAVSDLPQSR